MSPIDRIVKVEMSKIDQLVARGLGRYEAIQAVEAGVDPNTVHVADRRLPGEPR